MAGTAVKTVPDVQGGLTPPSMLRQAVITINKIITDLETLRAGVRNMIQYAVENLAADADIAARAIMSAPVALTILDSVKVIPAAASVGVDGSNTAVVTLRNITEGVNIATVTSTTNWVANTPVVLTLTSANADIAASDVLGIVVTNGTAADLPAFLLQFEWQRQTADAAADLTAAKIQDLAGTEVTA